jgi:hypothetical protein
VISNSRRSAGSPVSAKTCRTVARISLRSICTPDRLTAMRCKPCPASSQALAWRHAARSAHSPMGTIRPESSASGMNLSGGIIPRSPRRQRSKASAPISRSSDKAYCG